jgi:hypothetical protein
VLVFCSRARKQEFRIFDAQEKQLDIFMKNKKSWTARFKVLSGLFFRRMIDGPVPTERPPLVGEVSANFCG